MQLTEFRAAVAPLLKRYPFVPFRIEGTRGRTITVDGLDQLEIRPGESAVLHYPRAGRQVEVPYADITAVRPYDEMPAEDGALGYRDFYATLRPLYWAEPFKPFAIEFVDGDRLVIEDSHLLLLSGRTGVYLGKNRPAATRFAVNRVVAVSLVVEAEVQSA